MENEIYHYGIKGMRWGIRRYQNKDGSLTSLGKKRKGTQEDDTSDKSEKESYEERKRRAIKSGSASEVLKYKGDLTPSEMQSAINRIRWEQDMKSISEKEVSAGKARADRVLEKIGTTTEGAVKLAKAYNMAANVFNAFNGRGSILPKIDTNVTNGNRDERRAWKKEQKKEADAKQKRAEQESQRESKHQERAEKRARQDQDNRTYTGTVEGEGTSRRKPSGSPNNTKAPKDPIDVEWRDVPMSDAENSAATQAGRSYITGLLEEKNK